MPDWMMTRRTLRFLLTTAALALASLLLFRYARLPGFAGGLVSAGLIPAWVAARALGPLHGALVAGIGVLGFDGPLAPAVACSTAVAEVLVVTVLKKRWRVLPAAAIDGLLWTVVVAAFLGPSDVTGAATGFGDPRVLYGLAVSGAGTAAAAALLLALPLRVAVRRRWFKPLRVDFDEVVGALVLLPLLATLVLGPDPAFDAQPARPWLSLLVVVLVGCIPGWVAVQASRLRWSSALPQLEQVTSSGALPQHALARSDVVRLALWLMTRVRRKQRRLVSLENQLHELLKQTSVMFGMGFGDAATGHIRYSVLRLGSVDVDGYSKDDPTCLDGEWWASRLHPDDIEAYRSVATPLLEHGVLRGTRRIRSRNGQWRVFQTETTLVDRIGDSRYRFTCIAVDVTEQAIRQSHEQNTTRLLTFGRLAAGIAHEINQPLNVIRLAAENALAMMDSPGGTDYARERLDRITRQVERAAKITGQLRVLGRMPEDVRESFELEPALRTVVDLTAQELLSHDIALVFHGAPGGARVHGARQLFEQCVINLVLNARDSILERRAQGGTRAEGDWVELVAERDRADKLRVSVRDTGTGIPDEILPHIFDAFFSTKDVSKGSGIGLSLVHGVITSMGGRIEVSNYSAGACFTLCFPAGAGDATAATRTAPTGGQDDVTQDQERFGNLR